MIAVVLLLGPTRASSDRQPGAEFPVDTEEACEPAAFGGVSIETHADEKRQYPL
ncbi:hypothetical protein Htur_0630 [Haloterrigena turkmenica DSM 5511]|uniref:Uncharacterized protein n=1 Tax=Haloterrigena turkmenica (strain ATCC 51198 / DSM 5511 / JCM 9101 / NCIMB 13204 / VKM B-1734 / 4k) TaxID=543526 RepID=D2RWD9_HALTV|nr:hypothetical protein Htur_0630 [Haloterrigena turkmenica DSM 5511]